MRGNPTQLSLAVAAALFLAFTTTGCPEVLDDPLAPRLVILDQLADPPAVAVAASVTVPTDGWLAVYQSEEGEPGNLLGYTKVGKGERENVPVPLSRPVVHAEILHFRLLQDLGEEGTFEPEIDTPYQVNGTPIGGSIQVTLPLVSEFPRLTVFDQTCEPENQVVIDTALSLGRGWVVVLDDNGGNANAILGYTALADGPNKDVIVTLNRDVEYQEPLHAALHVDNGEIGVWEPEIDVRAKDPDGGDVAATFIGTLPIVVPNLDLETQSFDLGSGGRVMTYDVVSDGRGIVVIRGGGSPTGEIIGWTAVNGNDGDTEVELTRQVLHREELWAGLYVDVDPIGEWDPAVDGPIQVDPLSSEEQSGTFEVRYNPVLTAEDQTATPANTVVIAQAHSTFGGFVAVFADDGTVVGSASVNSGDNTDIAVTLNRDVINGETLTASLWEDSNNSGTFEEDQDSLDGDLSSAFVAYLTFDADLTVADTSATDLTSRVEVASVTSDGPGWLVFYDDDAGAPGSIMGTFAVSAGTSAALLAEIGRPFVDAETVHVALHSDASPVGEWDPGTDLIQTGASGDVTGTFVVTVPADLPDGRIVMGNMGNVAYELDSQEPAWLDAVGSAAENPSLNLTLGWRYAILNLAAGAHPFELRDSGGGALLSQGNTGSLETDPDVNYVAEGSTMTFTAAASLQAVVNDYVCTIHPAMSGSVTIQ